jgi:N-acetylmuramoyl-L-alanine amidase
MTMNFKMKTCENNYFKRLAYTIIVCLAGLFTYLPSTYAQQGTTVKTIVIDAGHGGHDPGAIGAHGNKEASLALAVSLKFGLLVEKNYPDIKVIYTRKTDKFLSLNERADIANKAKADLFFCIHLNAAENRAAYGSSTYALGLHRTEENLAVAKRENAVIDLEEGGAQNYDFNPNSPEGHIIMSMKQNAFLDQSLKIASHIEDEQIAVTDRKSRGVKQAGFYVLYKTSMPSILTEIGFISNLAEEAFLSSEKGQQLVAQSLLNAFTKYKNEIEGKKEGTIPLQETPVVKDVPKEKTSTPIPSEKGNNSSSTIVYTPIDKVAQIDKTTTETVQKTNTSSNLHTSTVFRVQFMASNAYPKNRNEIETKFGSILLEDIGNKMIRFMIGDFSNSNAAQKAAQQIKTMGFPGAFVTAYEEGIRVSNKRLSELLD